MWCQINKSALGGDIVDLARLRLVCKQTQHNYRRNYWFDVDLGSVKTILNLDTAWTSQDRKGSGLIQYKDPRDGQYKDYERLSGRTIRAKELRAFHNGTDSINTTVFIAALILED